MFTLEQIVESLQGPRPQAAELPAELAQLRFRGAAIDSREVGPGQLFVALTGERSDGHAYLPQVVARGARGALVSAAWLASQQPLALDRPTLVLDPAQPWLAAGAAPDADSFVLIPVEQTLPALQQLARAHRARHQLKVVGITGSVGKTSTKELLAVVLAQRFNTLKSPRSFNTESTVPLTVLELDPQHEAAVIEMGTYGPGEIALLASIARPQVGIVANVGPSHLERMKTLDTVALAKGELVEALPADGYAILNYDDQRVRAMASRTAASVLTYGLDPAADLWADAIESRGLRGIAFNAHYQGQTLPLELPLIGRHSVQTALAATAAGLVLGLSWDELAAGLRNPGSQPRLIALPGRGGSTIIDDSYNASPVSTLAALNLLSELEGRKIAVLGDMLELGPLEEQGHRSVGEGAARVVDLLVVVGERAQWIAEGARSVRPDLQILVAPDKRAVIDQLWPLLGQGDYLLVKAGRAMALEEIVAALRAPGEEANG